MCYVACVYCHTGKVHSLLLNMIRTYTIGHILRTCMYTRILFTTFPFFVGLVMITSTRYILKGKVHMTCTIFSLSISHNRYTNRYVLLTHEVITYVLRRLINCGYLYGETFVEGGTFPERSSAPLYISHTIIIKKM